LVLILEGVSPKIRKKTLTFPFKPKLFFIFGQTQHYMKKMKTALLAALLWLAGLPLLAHPGHDETTPHAQDPNSLMHYLTSPVHIAGIVLGVVVVVGAVLALRAQGRKRRTRA
jgi:hypothetical protein